MVFTINITNTSGDVGTIEPDAGFLYTDQLNRMNQASLRFSGIGAIRKGLLEVGSKVEILRNGTREFFGLIQEINFLSGGAVVANVQGFEVWLALENGAYAGSPWAATASATIATAVIGESNEFTAGTIEAGSSIDFRAQNTDSLYNVLSNLVRKTQQDIGIDYINLEVDVLDHKGSSTSVATLNAGIEISNVRIDHFYPRGNIIRVIGSSEGETKITGFAEDATSKTTYGNITLEIRDRTISTTAEANLLADAELAINKDPIKVYDFDVNNFNLNIVSGDVLTLNARSQGIAAESVRAVGVQRGVQGNEEFMILQVTNTEHARSLKRRNELVSEIEKASRQNEDYGQFDTEYSNRIIDTTIAGVIAVGTGSGAVGLAPINTNIDFWFLTGGSGDIYLSPGTSGQVLITGLVGLHMGNNKIVSLEDPTSAQDAATKIYVDNAGGGIRSVHTSGVVSVNNISSAAWINVANVNNVSVTSGDTVLVFAHGYIDIDVTATGMLVQLAKNNAPLIGMGKAMSSGGELEDVPFGLTNYDTPSTGTYTFSLQAMGNGTSSNDILSAHIGVIVFK